MWLAFPSLIEFGTAGETPEPFKPTCHIVHDRRVIDMNDGLAKWSGRDGSKPAGPGV